MDDRGETLVELLITLVIMSTAVIALVTGIGAAIKMSDIHRKEATAGAYVRDYADAIESFVTGSATVKTGYTPCPPANPTAPATTYQAAYTIPDTHYTANPPGIAYWDTSTSPASWNTSGCPSNGDSGIQRLSLSVSSNDGRANEKLVIVIRLPCRSKTDFPLDAACT